MGWAPVGLGPFRLFSLLLGRNPRRVEGLGFRFLDLGQ